MVNHHAKAGKSMGSGLYRVQDLDGDDKFDKITLIRELNGAGEHGPHSIIVAPDSVSLYLVSGNHTDLPDMDDYLLPNVWQADNLFPPIKYPRGHANSRGDTGGGVEHIYKLGKNKAWRNTGNRNPLDL